MPQFGRKVMKPTTIFFAKLLAELVKDTPQETRDFTKEIFAESDRGVALICTEDLNLKLELLFRMRFPIPKPQVRKIVDPLFKVGGPLSSFFYRITLAYSLGYINQPLYSELGRLRSIRNKFAHSCRPLRFHSPP